MNEYLSDFSSDKLRLMLEAGETHKALLRRELEQSEVSQRQAQKAYNDYAARVLAVSNEIQSRAARGEPLSLETPHGL